MDDTQANQYQWDVFVSYASEDRSEIVLPLAEELRMYGLRVWFDRFTLNIGDSLREKVDEGLAESRFGIVILSPFFFAKNWPKQELNGLFAKEVGGRGTILPVLHEMTHEDILKHSPMIADKVAISSSEGIHVVAQALVRVIRPEALLTETSLLDTQLAAKRLLQQLTDKNPNLDFSITVGPNVATGTHGVTQMPSFGIRIDAIARNLAAYEKNPITLQVKMTKDAWDRFQAGLREGNCVNFGPGDILDISPDVFSFFGFHLAPLQAFNPSPSTHLGTCLLGSCTFGSQFVAAPTLRNSRT